MPGENPQLDAIDDIRRMMHQSSRFIGLSGWSGVSAGICALLSAAYTAAQMACWKRGDCLLDRMAEGSEAHQLRQELLAIGLVTFGAAFALAFLFTFIRSRKTGVPIWGLTARRVVIQAAIPMLAGGLLIWRMMQLGFFGLVAPACLLFYGLALVNASKYTLPEIRYLGYCQLVLGALNLWLIGYGLYFWAAGFGVLHIVYGIVMWNKYERNP